MCDNPFGIPTSPYGWEEEEEDEETRAIRRMQDALNVDEDMELIDHLREQTYDSYTPTAVALSSAQAPKGSGNRKQAKRQADLVKQVLGQTNLLIDNSKQFYVYQEGGYYQQTPDFEVYLIDHIPEDTLDALYVRDITDIIERISWTKSTRCSLDKFNYRRELVNLENGVFNIETGELLEHSPSYRFNYVVHANYLTNKEKIACPMFDQFCQTSLDGDSEKRLLLLEAIGYICTDTNDGKCAIFLKGQPNSGKSVVVEFISKLFDPELVANVPLHQLGERFFRAELAGRKVNISGELAGRKLNDISTFKSVTGNDRIAGQFKGKKPFYFVPHCKLLFAGNTLPHTTEADVTAAFVNRIKIILFNTSVAPEEQDKELLDKLWAERDSIITLALDAVLALVKRNYAFTLPEDSRRFLRSFELRGNEVKAFVEDCCELSPAVQVFNSELYSAYKDYCVKNGLDALSKCKFYELLLMS